MPHIEILPNSTSTSAPGWAYVPDTGPDPSKLAIQPSGARKRFAARASHIGDSTTRQTNAVLKHLAELDRDGGREVQIPVGGKGGRVSKAKMTQSVRRVLTSQKTFANYLADEEAALSTQSLHTPSSAPTPRASIAKTPLKRASTSLSTPAPALPTPATPTAPPPAPPLNSTSPPPHPHHLPNSDPFLRSYIPAPPSSATISALVSAPPLPYNAARATAPASGRPARRFCEICGFWGRVRCMKCGARACGVECLGTHGEGRCLKFYA